MLEQRPYESVINPYKKMFAKGYGDNGHVYYENINFEKYLDLIALDDQFYKVLFEWIGTFERIFKRQIAYKISMKLFENGELYVEIVKEIDEKISNLQPLNTIDVYATINKNQEIVFNKEQLEYVVFDELMGVNKITGTLKINQLNNNFGIMFDYRLNQSSYFYELDYLNKQMQFNRGDILSDDLFKYTMNDLYINENEVDFTLLFEERTEAAGSIVTLYINNQMALTARMFRLDKTNFGFYSKGNDITVSNLKLYK